MSKKTEKIIKFKKLKKIIKILNPEKNQLKF
jgi:hypothetical protein